MEPELLYAILVIKLGKIVFFCMWLFSLTGFIFRFQMFNNFTNATIQMQHVVAKHKTDS